MSLGIWIKSLGISTFYSTILIFYLIIYHNSRKSKFPLETSKSFRYCLIAVMTANKWKGSALVFHSVLVHIAHNALILLQRIIHIIFTPAWYQKPFFKRRSCIEDKREDDVPAPFLLSHSVHTLSSPCLCSSRWSHQLAFSLKTSI